jgi:early endosome antigen 1
MNAVLHPQKLEADALEVKASKEQALQSLQQQRQLSTDLELRNAELSRELQEQEEV